MYSNCIICTKIEEYSENTMKPFITDIKDYEYGVKKDRELRECTSCGLVSIHPIFHSKDLLSLYPSEYSSYSNKSNSKSLFSYIKSVLNKSEARKVANHIPYGGTLLEVGCGNGLFLEEVNKIRPDIKLIGFDIVETNSIDKNLIHFHIGEFESYKKEIDKCDLIYFSNLIEHVIDPIRFLNKCNSALNNSGFIYGVTPNHDSLDRKIFKKYWGGYHYPRHINIFNHKNIMTILKLTNFKIIKTSGLNGFWYVSFANFLIELNGYKKRGVTFAMCALLFLPLDIFLNLFTVHGSMTFIGKKA